MAVATALDPEFTRIEVENSFKGMSQVWHLIDPSVCDENGRVLRDIDQEIWLDVGREEVNPCNGRWAVQMNREMPESNIYELNGIFFAIDENKAVIYKSPLMR